MSRFTWIRTGWTAFTARWRRGKQWILRVLTFVWARVRQYAWLLVTATVLVIVWLTFKYWDWLSNDLWGWLATTPGRQNREETNSSTLRNVGLLIAGFVALLIAGWRSWVAGRQAKTAEQNLLNDRYQKGSEMLGNDVLSVRLGGIYALQRLAEEHPEQYHIQIMRLFCAFARHPTKDNTLESVQPTEDFGSEMSEADAQLQDLLDRLRPNPWSQMREDVKAVVEAIQNRGHSRIALERSAYYRLDLQGANLASMLSMSDFSDAELSRANLSSTYLWKANFSSASLFFANLSNAWLSGANLSGAHLSGANLSDAKLQGAENLTQSQLDEACADPKNPPKLEGTVDSETGKPLVWRGNPLNDVA